jgi:hypothetical protein
MLLSLLLQDRARVKETIDRILAEKEFRPAKGGLGSWLAEKFEKLADWISELFGLHSVGSARAMLVTFLILVAVLLGWAVARAIALRRPAVLRNAPAPAPDRRAATVAALRAAAREAAARGDHLAALRLAFRALVVGLSERGDLAYRDAWTNRELLERGAPRREVLPLLAALVPRLDAQSFGREPATAEDFARIDSLCDRLLARGAAA